MSVTYDFAGQVALVTGAASGMGLAAARAFAHAGAAVTLADISKDALQNAVDEIKSAGGNAIGVRCDVSDESQVAAMVERTVATFGRLDAAFNNAGVQAPASDVADQPAEAFDRVNAIKSAWCVGLREARAFADAKTRQRSDRQLLVDRRADRPGAACCLSRFQAWRDRPDAQRSA